MFYLVYEYVTFYRMYWKKYYKFMIRHNIGLFLLIIFIFFFIKLNLTNMNMSNEYTNNYEVQNFKKSLISKLDDKNKKSLDIPINFKTQLNIKVIYFFKFYIIINNNNILLKFY